MKKWDVLVQVTGWVKVGQVEADDEEEAIRLGGKIEDHDLDPDNLYDGLEKSQVAIEVEEA